VESTVQLPSVDTGNLSLHLGQRSNNVDHTPDGQVIEQGAHQMRSSDIDVDRRCHVEAGCVLSLLRANPELRRLSSAHPDQA